MKTTFHAALLCAVGVAAPLAILDAQQLPPAAGANAGRTGRAPLGPVQSDRYRTSYVRLGSNNDEGLLYEPLAPGPNARIALLYSHPSGNNFNVEVGPEMASRGYRVLMVNHHGEEEGPTVFVAGISRGIAYLRSLPGVKRVVISGHSGGGHQIGFYANVAENGPAGCQGAGRIAPCRSEAVTGLEKPDGVVLLDPTLGAFHQMSAVDPAVDGRHAARKAALDMFSAANGYDVNTRSASYSAEFARRFYAAQAARNAAIVDHAMARLKLIEQGKGDFTDDEPLVIPGMGVNATGARLYQPDTRVVSHTRRPHLLLRADGSQADVIVHSVRPPSGLRALSALGSLESMTQNTTVRRFLANSAIRTTPDFAMTEDDIVGVDWRSASNSSPGSAEGITVPTLVLTMSCHYLVVPGEIIYDHLAARDKTYASVEGAVHNFTPCKPEYVHRHAG